MSFTELLILGVFALVVLGPEELPVMARKLARFINELRKVKDDLLGPLNEFHQSTTSLLNQSRDSMHKELVDLINLKNQLDQEIFKRQNPGAIPPEAATPPAVTPPSTSQPAVAAPVVNTVANSESASPGGPASIAGATAAPGVKPAEPAPREPNSDETKPDGKA